MVGLNNGVSDQALETAKNKLKLELLSAVSTFIASSIFFTSKMAVLNHGDPSNFAYF